MTYVKSAFLSALPRATITFASLWLAALACSGGGAASPAPTIMTGTMYYLSPSGDDTADGRSPTTAWRTIERVNQGEYFPGDRILFEGGQLFNGSLQFSPQNAHGTLQSPVTISSYGEGRATLIGGGFAAGDVAGFAIEMINFTGDTDASASAISIIHEQPATISGLRVTDVEISGFAYAILVITGEVPAKVQDIYIERVSAHDNAAGPSFFGYLTQSGTVGGHYGIGNLYIGHSEFFNHTGANQYNLGYGLTLMNAENVTIEYSLVHDNGGDNLPAGADPNGPSAITIYDGHNITLQNNEIYHQRVDPDGPTDNAGIDIWATDSVVQYNYIHDNEGWGMVLGAGDPTNQSEVFPWPSERLTIRYNIFENNARRLPDSASIPELLGAQLMMFGPIKDFEIYNNTFYSPNAMSLVPEAATQAMVSIYAVGAPYREPQGLRFRNNVFIAEDQVRFVETTAVEDIRFENNAYIGGAPVKQVTWGSQTYFDAIAAWSEATSQEIVDGAFTAKLAGMDALCAPGKGVVNGYRLASHSSLIDAGADLLVLGLQPGFTDFFGNGVPYPILNDLRSTFDIGANEWQAGERCETLPIPTPNPANGIVGAIRWDAWVGELPTFGDATSEERMGLVVERTLSPAHWHYRLPFFAVEISENQVWVREDTQKIMDQQIAYATQAGLDYWAFVYYPPGSGLDLARNLYLSSSYRDAINFSLVLDGNYFLDPTSRNLFVEYFNMPNYQKVLDGRPLLYIFGESGLTLEGIDLLRADTANAGLASPYIVYMGWSAAEVQRNIEDYGLDAGSAYAQSGMNGQSFESLAREAEAGWESYQISGIKVIPWVTTGWDPRPRVENPLPWTTYSPDQWAQTATPDEIAVHLQNALIWNATYPETAEANAIIIYAWNEFDEGGWLCPTLYNAGDRLDAISSILLGH